MKRVKRATTSGKTKSVRTSQRYLATENIELSKNSVHRAMRRAGLKPYRPTDKPELTPARKQARLAFCQRMIQKDDSELREITFHDEKHFTVDSGRVQYVWVAADDHKPRHRTHTHPMSLYVSGVISWWGKSRLVFYARGQKVNADTYLHTLKNRHIPDINELFEDGDFTWMQDGVGFHTAKKGYRVARQRVHRPHRRLARLLARPQSN